MSITPAAVDATTITASDENTRNNNISTPYNAHDHTDISQTANTLNVGDAAAGNKTITAYNADTNKPFIRYDDTNNRWIFSDDGSTDSNVIHGNALIFEGTTADAFETTFSITDPTADRTITFPNSSITVGGGDILYSDTRFYVGSFTRDQATASGTQAVTGVGFAPKAVIFLALELESDEASWGIDDGTTGEAIGDDNGDVAGTWSTNTGQSIQMRQTNGTTKYDGEITTLGSDGFTITWTKTGSPTGTASIYYLALR